MISRGARYPSLQKGKTYVFDPDVGADAVPVALANKPDVTWEREMFERGKFLFHQRDGYHFEGCPLGNPTQIYHFHVLHFEGISVEVITETC